MEGKELEKIISDWSELVYNTMSLSEEFKEEFPYDSGRKYLIPELNKLGLECWLEHGEVSTYLVPDKKFIKCLDFAKLLLTLDQMKSEGFIDSYLGEDGEERFFIPEDKKEEVEKLIKSETK